MLIYKHTQQKKIKQKNYCLKLYNKFYLLQSILEVYEAN